MKTIPLTQGKVALCDDADFEWLSQWKWCAYRQRSRWYACRHTPLPNGRRNLTGMHSLILETPKGMDTDHIDNDGLNNQRTNLRVCTRAQNLRNQKKRASVLFKGVHFIEHQNKWVASITVNRKRLHLGHFDSAIEAAREYDLAANHYFGEFAKTNFPVDPNTSWKLETPFSRGKTSRFRGASWNKREQKWRANIMIRGKPFELGRFESEIAAAQAYNNAALKYRGASAKLNDIEAQCSD